MAKKAAATKKKAPKNEVSMETKTTVKTVTVSGKQSFGKHLEGTLSSRTLWRALAAEVIGTFLLASVILASQGSPIFVLFGLAGIVLLLGAVSGAHVNPAITLAAWATRRISLFRTVGYIFAQFLGASLAFFVFSAFIGGATQPTAEQQMYGQSAASLFKAADIANLGGKEWYVFFSELLGTAVLGFGVAVALKAKDALHAAFSAGFGIFLGLMIAITTAGYVSATTIMNPAVALSLQAYSTSTWSYVAYALGPVIGGVLGFLIHDLVRGKKTV